MYWIGLTAAVFWAVGTDLLDPRWYVLHGISVGDVLFGCWMLLAITRPRTSRLLAGAARRIQGLIALMAVFVVWMLLSLAVNAFRFGAHGSDILAILRLLYFCAMMVFCVAYVEEFGSSTLIMAFVAGVALLTLGRLTDAMSGGVPVLFGLPLLRDPNVVGNMLGVGVLFNSLLILQGRTRWPLVMTVAFTAASAFTFSKGTWLMVLLGIGANLMALIMRYPLSPRGLRRLVASAAALLLVLGYLAYSNVDRLSGLIAFKLQTTEANDTAGERYRFALAGFYAMADYPLFGLGFRNYPVVETLYPEIITEPSENAHNVFIQVGAVGGLPALFLLMLLFIYPFPFLWMAVRIRYRGLAGIAYVALAFAVFLVSGAVQLQIIAQPFFWFFTGIVRGRHYRGADRRVLADPRRAFPPATVPAQ